MEIKRIPFESTWDLRHQVMWPDKPLDYVKLNNDQDGLHYGLFEGDQLVSVVSAFIANKEAQFRKFATLQSEQGKGYGSKLLNHLFLELTNLEMTRIWCNARTDKTGFYEQFGMTQAENKFDKGGINYVIMENTAESIRKAL